MLFNLQLWLMLGGLGLITLAGLKLIDHLNVRRWRDQRAPLAATMWKSIKHAFRWSISLESYSSYGPRLPHIIAFIFGCVGLVLPVLFVWELLRLLLS